MLAADRENISVFILERNIPPRIKRYPNMNKLREGSHNRNSLFFAIFGRLYSEPISEPSYRGLLLVLSVQTFLCQEDPCQPNPCGDNTRCSSTFINASPVISCECLIGFKVPDGGDPFDGCYEVREGFKKYSINK